MASQVGDFTSVTLATVVAEGHLWEEVAHCTPIHGLTIQEGHHIVVPNGPLVFMKERAAGETDRTVITPESTIGFFIAHHKHWLRVEVSW
jgi:hypothetical protein